MVVSISVSDVAGLLGECECWVLQERWREELGKLVRIYVCAACMVKWRARESSACVSTTSN